MAYKDVEDAGETEESEQEEGSERSDEDILAEAHARFKVCVDNEETERAKQLADLKFRTLDQWPADMRMARENDPHGARPCLTVDKLGQYVQQIINEIRKNRPSVKIRPVDNGADPKTAEVFQGVIRQVENDSTADAAYEMAAKWAIDTGSGYFRFLTDYISPDSFEQKLIIKSIPNAFSVYLGEHMEADGSDTDHGFVVDDLPREVFAKDYPNSKLVKKKEKGSSGGFEITGDKVKYWDQGEAVRIVEYFYTEYEHGTLYRTADGNSVFGKTPPKGVEIIDTRPTVKKSVKWCKLTAAEVLEKNDWPGKYIPIVEVLGHEMWVEGKHLKWGIIRPALDSARNYNYWSSVLTETMALNPKAPYIVAAGQIDGFESDWANANRINMPVLQYNPIDINGQPVAPPQRQSPMQMQTAIIQHLKLIEHDIQAALGMYSASVGSSSSDQSGVAIQSLVRQSDTATFHFPDNLAKAIRHGGRIMLDLIPKIYDTKRVQRILGDDGKTGLVTLDPEQKQASSANEDARGNIKEIYNLGIGTYDVTATVGPSYATKRMESSAFMQEISKSNPELLKLIGHVMFRELDINGADKIADIFEKMLPPELKGDGPPPVPPEIQQQMGQMQEDLQKMQQENQQLKSGAEEAQAKIAARAEEAKGELELKKKIQAEEAAIERERLEADIDLAQKKADADFELAQQKFEFSCAQQEDKIKLERHAKTAENRLAGIEDPYEQEQVNQQTLAEVAELRNSLAEAFAGLAESIQQQTMIQQQVVEALNRPKSVSIGGIQKDSSGRIVGATVIQE